MKMRPKQLHSLRSAVKVLDHGEISCIDCMGGDLAIAQAARTSYDAAWRAGNEDKSDAKLINYLMKNKHNTPFEAVTLKFFVKAPIFVVRQWHRHRTFSYSEMSARYTELPEEFYVPDLHQITTQSKDNKQMRTDETNEDALNIRSMLQQENHQSFLTYKAMIERGCPRELARSVLPCGTYTKMFVTGNLHNYFHFLRLRLHEHAQYEIRVYAEEMLKACQAVAPVATAAFLETL